MSVALRTITRLQDADDVNVTLGAGVDEYALTYDHDTGKFVLRAPFAGLLATGATTGATSQAQAFTNGIVGPSWKPSADSTTALQLQRASGTPILNVDTTNARVGIGTNSPSDKLHVYAGSDLSVAFDGGSGYVEFILKRSSVSWSQGTGYAGAGSTGNFYIWNNIAGSGSTGAKLVIQQNGLVGIGTTAPATRFDIDAGAMTMAEMTAPTGAANKAMLYTKDNGSGKTQLCVKLGDDVEIVIATQA